MAIDDLLKSAFAQPAQDAQSFQQSYQATNQTGLGYYDANAGMAKALIERDTQLQGQANQLRMKQAEIQQNYALKIPEMLNNALKPETSPGARKGLIDAMPQMWQRAGLPAMSPDYLEMLHKDPDFGASQAALMDWMTDPMNPDKQATYNQIVTNATQSTWADRGTMIEASQKQNKPMIDLMGKGMTGNIKLGNSAGLDLFKDFNKRAEKIIAHPAFENPVTNIPVIDMSTGTTARDPKTGKPFTINDLTTELAPFVKDVESGAFKPDAAMAYKYQRASEMMGGFEKQAAAYDDAKKNLDSNLKEIQQIPTSGLSPDQQAKVDSLIEKGSGATGTKIWPLYRESGVLLSQLKTNQDQTQRGRQIEDQTGALREKQYSDLQAVTTPRETVFPAVDRISQVLRNPNVTNQDINSLSADYQNLLKQNSSIGPNGEGLAQTTLAQTISNLFNSIANTPPNNPADPALVSRLSSNLTMLKQQVNQTTANQLYDRYHTLSAAGGPVYKGLSDVKGQYVQKLKELELTPPSTNWVKGALYGINLPGGQYKPGAVQAYGGSLSKDNAQQIKADIAHYGIRSGYDPITIDRMVDAELRKQKKEE